MEEIGEIIHLAKSGRLIVKLTKDGKETNSGDILLDANGKRIGKIIEVIGPVTAPYASVAPMIDRENKIIGIKVFSGGFLPKRQGSRRKDYARRKGFGVR